MAGSPEDDSPRLEVAGRSPGLRGRADPDRGDPHRLRGARPRGLARSAPRSGLPDHGRLLGVRGGSGPRPRECGADDRVCRHPGARGRWPAARLLALRQPRPADRAPDHGAPGGAHGRRPQGLASRGRPDGDAREPGRARAPDPRDRCAPRDRACSGRHHRSPGGAAADLPAAPAADGSRHRGRLHAGPGRHRAAPHRRLPRPEGSAGSAGGGVPAAGRGLGPDRGGDGGRQHGLDQQRTRRSALRVHAVSGGRAPERDRRATGAGRSGVRRVLPRLVDRPPRAVARAAGDPPVGGTAGRPPAQECAALRRDAPEPGRRRTPQRGRAHAAPDARRAAAPPRRPRRSGPDVRG